MEHAYAWTALQTGIAALGLIFSGVPGCDRGTAPAPTRPADRLENIAVISAGPDDPLGTVITRAAARYQRDLRDYQLILQEPALTTPAAQARLLADLDPGAYRALCIHISDPQPLLEPLRRLRTAGLVVVPIGGSLPRDLRDAEVSYDQRSIGAALAQAAAAELEGRGSIVLLHAGTSGEIDAQRLYGCEEELKRHPGIELLVQEDCAADPARARQLIRDRYARFPRIAAWICLDDWPLRAVPADEPPLPEGVRLITFGGYPAQWPLIRERRILAVVAVDAGPMIDKALQYTEIALRHVTPIENRHTPDIFTITPATLDAHITRWHDWTGQSSPTTPAATQP